MVGQLTAVTGRQNSFSAKNFQNHIQKLVDEGLPPALEHHNPPKMTANSSGAKPSRRGKKPSKSHSSESRTLKRKREQEDLSKLQNAIENLVS